MGLTLHEVLGQKGLDIMNELLDSSSLENYYLAGGTGLALYLRHRRSYDLDFFCHENPSFSLLVESLKRYSLEGPKILLRSSEELSLMIHGVRITFLHFPFPLIHPLQKGEEISPFLKGLLLASPQEILLMKAYALGRRASFRDYIDIHKGLFHGLMTLEQIMEEARKKFVMEEKVFFSPKLFLEQLVYIDDIEDVDISLAMVAGDPLTKEEILNFLSGKVKEYLKNSTMWGGSL